jgi:hypothetical protein
MESPFATLNAIIGEPTNPVDELRIIAKDGGRLTEMDRDALRRGADEFENMQRALTHCYAEVLELRQKAQALTDRLNGMQQFSTLVTAINGTLSNSVQVR